MLLAKGIVDVINVNCIDDQSTWQTTEPTANAHRFLLAGIMTLPSSPCEIDNMSLFQDLKLKRRKVDSRCSSDGKNVSEIYRSIGSESSACRISDWLTSTTREVLDE
ncbi:hypothetical protein HN011_002832 [Eciton burchellii]|jgi:hypothetical protein|nr:hypothetical protein HN011_002832 [Eciton burchellii]